MACDKCYVACDIDRRNRLIGGWWTDRIWPQHVLCELYIVSRYHVAGCADPLHLPLASWKLEATTWRSSRPPGSAPFGFYFKLCLLSDFHLLVKCEIQACNTRSTGLLGAAPRNLLCGYKRNSQFAAAWLSIYSGTNHNKTKWNGGGHLENTSQCACSVKRRNGRRI